MGDKTNENVLEEFYANMAAAAEASRTLPHSTYMGDTINWNDRCTFGEENLSPPVCRMTSDRGTNNRFFLATPPARSSALLPTVQEAVMEKRQAEADFQKLLSDSGITEREFYLVVSYIRDTDELNKELKRQGRGEIKLSEMDLEQRVLADRAQRQPPQPRFPGTVDPRAYNIGLMPRTTIAAEFFYSGIKECIKPDNIVDCLGQTVSLVLDFLPVIGTVKGLIEAYTGKDLITGDEIPAWARVLNVGLAAIPVARAVLKVTRLAAKVAQSGARIAVKAIGPVAFVVAVAHRTPAETMHIFKTVAGLDETALKVALKEAQGVKGGVLRATVDQSKAIKELSRLLPPNEIADLEKSAAKKAAASHINKGAPPPPGKNLPDAPPALPVGEAKGASRAGRRPKTSPTPGAVPKPPVDGGGSMRPSLDTAGTGGIKKITMNSAKDGSITVTIEGELLEGTKRQKFEADLPLPKEVDLKGYERCHLWGAGFGDEARDGIMYGPRKVNQWFQNRGVEKGLRNMRKLAEESGSTIELVAKAESFPLQAHKGHHILRKATYSFFERTAKGRKLIGEVDITVPFIGATDKVTIEVTGDITQYIGAF